VPADVKAALLKAVREAAARGLSCTEATGMLKATLIRLQALESPKTPWAVAAGARAIQMAGGSGWAHPLSLADLRVPVGWRE
jgi:hypothetical protein